MDGTGNSRMSDASSSVKTPYLARAGDGKLARPQRWEQVEYVFARDSCRPELFQYLSNHSTRSLAIIIQLVLFDVYSASV